MVDNEIIKALECCKDARLNQDCLDLNCPFATEYGCNIGQENLKNVALDLINRQKAEIERLKKIEFAPKGYSKLSFKIKDIQTEALKRFVDELTSYGCSLEYALEHEVDVVVVETDCIYGLLEEMTGQQKNDFKES